MSFRLTSSALALALAAMTGPVLADVTPGQVWQSWLDYYRAVGYSVTEGGRTQAGDTLTVSDVVLTGGAEQGRITVRVPRAVLTGQDDGKVRTVLSDRLEVQIEGTEPEGGAYAVPVTIEMAGNSVLSSGAPQDMTHSFDYPTLDFVLTTITSNGKEAPLPMRFDLAGATGDLHVVAGTPARYDYRMQAGRLNFQGKIPDEAGGHVGFQGKVEGVRSQGNLVLPSAIGQVEQDLAAALAAGLDIGGQIQAGPMDATFEFETTDENGQPSSGTGSYEGKGWDATMALSDKGLVYQIATDGLKMQVSSPQMPFPISYGITGASFDMQLPVLQQDAPQPFKFAYDLSGVTLGDEIWNLFDPQKTLPRDPASLELDVTGLMRVTRNLFTSPPASAQDAGTDGSTDGSAGEAGPDTTPPADATDAATADGMAQDAPADDAEAAANQDEMAAQTAEPSPFEPVEVAINRVALDMLGARVRANGNLHAPEGGQMTTPVGRIHAEYVGVNGLLDKLTQLGLVAQEQASGLRMMLAMFAKPAGEGTDSLVSDIEFTEDGRILANGQPIQ